MDTKGGDALKLRPGVRSTATAGAEEAVTALCRGVVHTGEKICLVDQNAECGPRCCSVAVCTLAALLPYQLSILHRFSNRSLVEKR